MLSTSFTYKVTRIVNTYACKKAINNSRNIIAVTIAHGAAARSIMPVPVLRSTQEKPIRIFNRA
jgi:hypothetical protein